MAKEGYKPTSGMQAAARRAIKYKEQGKAKGAGTAVGWTRAGQLARGESLSLDTVKRMYSFFSRHEVDKKGKDWDNAENPSNGKIMWLAWGGDAGFSWSRAIVNREKKSGDVKKSLNNELVEEIKSILDDVVDPITIEKSVKPEVSKETLLEIIKELQEIIIGMVESEESTPEEVMQEIESEIDSNPAPVGDPDKNDVNWPVTKSNEEPYQSDNEEEDKWDNLTKACWSGYKQEGMKDKNGRMVPNCVPVEKAKDIENKEEPMKKSLWDGTFIK